MFIDECYRRGFVTGMTMRIDSFNSLPEGASLFEHKVSFLVSRETAIVDPEWTACGQVSFVNDLQRSSLNCSKDSVQTGMVKPTPKCTKDQQNYNTLMLWNLSGRLEN